MYFNEYLIKYTDLIFWECLNCYNDKNETGKFDFGLQEVWKNERNTWENMIKFHPTIPGKGEGGCGPDFYTFVFKTDDITELYKGGINGSFELITDYYTFGNESQIIIEKNINYSRYDTEFELINFKQDDIIYAKSSASNNTLAYKNDNNDFIYKICIENKEGQLKGFDTNNSQININTGDCFFEISGINYKLGDNEAKVNLKYQFLKIALKTPVQINIATIPLLYYKKKILFSKLT